MKANYEIGNYYAWYRNAVLIPQETAPLYTATQGGAYKVVVQNSGCAAESTTVLLWGGSPGTSPLITGLPPTEDSSQAVALYPNPTLETLMVSVRKSGSGMHPSATLLTMQGQTVISQPLLSEREYFKTEFEVKNLAAGTYLIKITAGSRIVREHFVTH